MMATRGWLVAAGLSLLVAGLPIPAAADSTPVPRAPKVAAASWLIADATTGQVLAAKHPHRQLKPASTLKTLTAITLLPRLDKQRKYQVRWADAAVEGSAVGIVPGATYTIDELFYGLLLPSGNDAAHALANAAGGMKRTVSLMAAEAERLNAQDTTVRNPSGLDARGQFTSAFDLALFARSGLERKDFRRYVGTVTTAFPAEMPKKDKRRKTYQIYNQNPLLLDGYTGVVGVKTGYTTLAGRTFVGAAERGQHSLIVTIMGVVEPTDAAAERLLNWGFANIGRVEPVGSLVGPPGTSHEVRSSAARTPVPAVDEPASAGSSVGLAFVITAAACLVTWLVLRRVARRQRRPSLPPL